MATIRKDRNGQYRVWSAYKDNDPSFERRYATATDAKDYIKRRGGYLVYDEFDSKETAEAFLSEKKGEIWW